MIVRAAREAAELWGYPAPGDAFIESVVRRIPDEVHAELDRGLKDGEVVVNGPHFSIPRLGPGKGPYAFFSRDRTAGAPAPNWEYFIQLAEYLRLRRELPDEFEVGFEDGLMDVSIRRNGKLVWYVEAKEREGQGKALLTRLDRYASAVSNQGPDRGNDALRKAKYLVKHQPPYFSVVAAQWRADYALRFPTAQSFELVRRVARPNAEELMRA